MINHTHLLPGRWRLLDKPEFGVMNNLSLSISRGEIAEPDLLPNLRQVDTLFVVSDFGGLHKTSPCETFSFLFVDPSSFAAWQDRWRAYRSRYLRDGRRMAFKSLSDNRRRQALIPFLQAANRLKGLVVTIIISKRLGSFFSESGKLEIDKEELREFSHWSPMAFERLLRAVHLVSFFVAGLSAPGQDVFWYTDEDDIAPNDARLYDVCEVYKRVSGHYLAHMMRHFRFGTSRSEDGTRILEDLIAIPDLAAGCLAELTQLYGDAGLVLGNNLLVPPPENLSYKSRLLLDWLAFSGSSLRRLVYAFEQGEMGSIWRRFHLFRDDPWAA